MKKFLMLLMITLACTRIVHAHPHTFITTHLDIEFIGEQIKGVWVTWEFDEMFSSSVIMDCDLNKDGRFNAQETALVYKDAFSNLKDYGYFFYIRQGNTRRSAQSVERFSVRKNNAKLVYNFFIPTGSTDTPLIMSIFDPTFFCAVTYIPKKPVSFLHAGKVVPQYAIVKNDKYPIYYNPAGAIDDQTVYTQWKPGLQTAYPEEVVISFTRRT